MTTSTPRELFAQAMAATAAAAAAAAQDPTRPLYHFLPPAQWMNDVCGAFFYRGYYHIFYQFHPWSDERGAKGSGHGIGWGHARSIDQVHWEHLPPALLPSSHSGDFICASGSAMIRKDGSPIVFFTYTPLEFPRQKRAQWAALPTDDELLAWQRLDVGLTAGKSGVPAAIKAIWADPFLFRAGGRTFVTFKESDGLICQAQNADLLSWKAVGRIEGAEGECPNLFALGERHVLIRSTYPISYLVGDFDPDRIDFRPRGEAQVMDYGYGDDEIPYADMARGLYGTTVFADARGRTILLGWISGFKTGRGWDGCMALPRVLSLDAAERLLQTPLPELERLRGKSFRIDGLELNDEARFFSAGKTCEIAAELLPDSASSFGLQVRAAATAQQGIDLCYAEGILDVAGTRVPLKLDGEALQLRLFLDRLVLEVFIGAGHQAVTRVIYPREEDEGLRVFASGGRARASLQVWEMQPIW